MKIIFFHSVDLIRDLNFISCYVQVDWIFLFMILNILTYLYSTMGNEQGARYPSSLLAVVGLSLPAVVVPRPYQLLSVYSRAACRLP